MSFGASDEPNEGDGEQDSDNELESDCASTTSGCTMNIAAQARDNWAHSEESSDEEDNDEYGTLTRSEMEDEDELEDELDNCSNSISDDEDIRF